MEGSDRVIDAEGPEPLHSRLLATISRGAGASLPDGEFESLALALFAYQFERNPIYRAFCEARGATPGTVRRSSEIPAIPTDAFRAAPLVCGDPADAVVTFRTSGTTRGTEQRGVHHLLDTDLYRASLSEGFRHALLPDRHRIRVLSMVASANEVPDSSLSFMVDTVIERFGTAESDFFASADALDTERLIETLAETSRGPEPVLLVGTSIAFAHLFERLDAGGRVLRMPAGSRAMDTGGFKGHRREIGRDELFRLASRLLGLPATHIVNEYGMTEMSSQLYDGVVGAERRRGAERRHRGPGWVRAVAVDAETLEPVVGDEVGIIRYLDLANLYSVAALQTADIGRVMPDGVLLLGRSTGAPPRGCSLAMEELLELLGGE
jgi:hypothetical protein